MPAKDNHPESPWHWHNAGDPFSNPNMAGYGTAYQIGENWAVPFSDENIVPTEVLITDWAMNDWVHVSIDKLQRIGGGVEHGYPPCIGSSTWGYSTSRSCMHVISDNNIGYSPIIRIEAVENAQGGGADGNYIYISGQFSYPHSNYDALLPDRGSMLFFR